MSTVSTNASYRAAAAEYEALVLTVDTAVLGRRERDVRRGFSLPPAIGPGTLIDGALHPGWTWSFVRSEPIRFANVAGRAYLYGLGAAGERGVDRVLDWFHADVIRTMSLLGAATIADLDRTLIDATRATG